MIDLHPKILSYSTSSKNSYVKYADDTTLYLQAPTNKELLDR